MTQSFIFCDSKKALEKVYSIDHYYLEKESFSFTPLCPSDYRDALCIYGDMLPLISGNVFSNDGKLIGYKIWKKVKDEHYHCMIEIIEKSQRRKGFSTLLSSNMKGTVFPNVKYLTKITTPENASIECEPKNFIPLHLNNRISVEELMLIKNLNSSYESRIIKEFYQVIGGHGCIKSYRID